MRLKNKKTGEIVDTLGTYNECCGIGLGIDHHDGNPTKECYRTLAELNEEWEDYEKPKEYWYISCDGKVLKATADEDDYNETHITGHKRIGNYFETREEAEKAVEKFEALKRLVGGSELKFIEQSCINTDITIRAKIKSKGQDFIQLSKDLDLLFGGEE